MKALIEAFPTHLAEAIRIGEGASFRKPAKPIRNVLITGLGGSGIGGTIVAQVVAGEAAVPVVVNKDYSLPAFVDEHTLVIVSSYSGNTEETVAALDAALEYKATVWCVTSGGKVLETAKAAGCDRIVIPSGIPPRAAFAYSFTQLLFALHGYGLIGDGFKRDLQQAHALLGVEGESIRKEAEALAGRLHGKIPVLYSEAAFEGVAVRWRQQINENAKMLCWHHALPEMNHNELVGWTQPNDSLAVVFLRNDTDHPRTKIRMDLTRGVVLKYTPHVSEVFSKGNTMLERVFCLIHLGDWVSWYLSDLRKIDATEVKVIDYLKGELAKVGE